MTITSIWSNIGSLQNVAVCEPLTGQLPQLPPRSWAYHLEPIGIGTPDCESLTSYVTRLSDAHCVTLRTLFERKINHHSVIAEERRNNRGLLSPNSGYGTWHVNGNGLAAEKWVGALEAITQRRDLRSLTFLPLRGGLSKRHMCRPERAWCSFCLEDQTRSHQITYERLLWTHKYVDVCPIHKARLATLCASCRQKSPILKGTILPGICPTCQGWLGVSRDSAHIESQPSEYETFVANEIGRLISVGISIKRPSGTRLRRKPSANP
jgi:hypothetical protein